MEPDANNADPADTAPRAAKLIVVLHADMEGYSRLIGRDDIGTVSRLRALRHGLIEPAILSHGGRIVQTGGDSLLVVFDSIDGALQCAIKIQREIPARDGDQPPEQQIRFRIGINIGDAIADGSDLHGNAVNVAARLQALCPAGCICVSRVVRDHARDLASLQFEELGPLSLKNISHPVDVSVLHPDTAAIGSRLPPAALPTLTRGGHTRLKRLSVMIVPLRNLGVPAEHHYLLEAVPEDIATALLQYPGLRLVDWPDGATGSPKDVARGLGAVYVIQGSLRGTADRLAVNVQLIDIESGIRLCAEPCEIDPGDGSDRHTESVSRVAVTLYEKLIEDAARRIDALPRSQWDTEDLVLKGMALVFRPAIMQSSPHSDRLEALRCFEQALDQTPGSLVAKVGIASVLIVTIVVGQSLSARTDEQRAEQLLEEVLCTGGRIAFAHLWMGILRQLQSRLDDALSELRLATELAPYLVPAIAHLGATLVMLGQPNEAIPLLERSLRLSAHDSQAPVSLGYLALCHILLGHPEQALAPLRTARTMNPRLHFIYILLAAALALMGEPAEACSALAQAVEISPNVAAMVVAFLARISPECVALYEATVYAGLRRAGLPDIWGDSNERPLGWSGILPRHALE